MNIPKHTALVLRVIASLCLIAALIVFMVLRKGNSDPEIFSMLKILYAFLLGIALVCVLGALSLQIVRFMQRGKELNEKTQKDISNKTTHIDNE